MDASLDVLLLKHMCDIVVFKQMLTDRVICNLSLRHFGTKRGLENTLSYARRGVAAPAEPCLKGLPRMNM